MPAGTPGPTSVNVVPSDMGVGAAGGAALPIVYNPVTAVTVQVCPAGAVTVTVSEN